MTAHDRYIRAARAKFAGDPDICVWDGCDARTRLPDPSPERRGTWVNARIFVHDDELEPIPGPTYDVWIGELKPHKVMDPNLLTFGGKTVELWVWTFDQSFTCDDDPDGKGARQSAHAYARYLRNTYPCAFVAVRPSGKSPLPIKHFTESSPPHA